MVFPEQGRGFGWCSRHEDDVHASAAHWNCQLQKAAALHSRHVTTAWPEEAFSSLDASISRFCCSKSCLALVHSLVFSFSYFFSYCIITCSLCLFGKVSFLSLFVFRTPSPSSYFLPDLFCWSNIYFILCVPVCKAKLVSSLPYKDQ